MQIVNGGLPTTRSLGATTPSYWYVDGTDVDQAQISLDGVTWTNQLRWPGGAAQMDVVDYTGDAAHLTFTPQADGRYTFFLRIHDSKLGWTDPFQWYADCYTGPSTGGVAKPFVGPGRIGGPTMWGMAPAPDGGFFTATQGTTDFYDTDTGQTLHSPDLSDGRDVNQVYSTQLDSFASGVQWIHRHDAHGKQVASWGVQVLNNWRCRVGNLTSDEQGNTYLGWSGIGAGGNGMWFGLRVFDAAMNLVVELEFGGGHLLSWDKDGNLRWHVPLVTEAPPKVSVSGGVGVIQVSTGGPTPGYNYHTADIADYANIEGYAAQFATADGAWVTDWTVGRPYSDPYHAGPVYIDRVVATPDGAVLAVQTSRDNLVFFGRALGKAGLHLVGFTGGAAAATSVQLGTPGTSITSLAVSPGGQFIAASYQVPAGASATMFGGAPMPPDGPAGGSFAWVFNTALAPQWALPTPTHGGQAPTIPTVVPAGDGSVFALVQNGTGGGELSLAGTSVPAGGVAVAHVDAHGSWSDATTFTNTGGGGFLGLTTFGSSLMTIVEPGGNSVGFTRPDGFSFDVAPNWGQFGNFAGAYLVSFDSMLNAGRTDNLSGDPGDGQPTLFPPGAPRALDTAWPAYIDEDSTVSLLMTTDDPMNPGITPNADGSNATVPQNVTVNEVTDPTASTDTSSGTSAPPELTVSWDQVAGNLGYTVYVSETGDVADASAVDTTDPNAGSYNLTGPAADTDGNTPAWTFWVTAKLPPDSHEGPKSTAVVYPSQDDPSAANGDPNAASPGGSAGSPAAVGAKTPAGVPGPADVQAKLVQDLGVQLSWTPAAGASGYVIFQDGTQTGVESGGDTSGCFQNGTSADGWSVASVDASGVQSGQSAAKNTSNTDGTVAADPLAASTITYTFQVYDAGRGRWFDTPIVTNPLTHARSYGPDGLGHHLTDPKTGVGTVTVEQHDPDAWKKWLSEGSPSATKPKVPPGCALVTFVQQTGWLGQWFTSFRVIAHGPAGDRISSYTLYSPNQTPKYHAPKDPVCIEPNRQMPAVLEDQTSVGRWETVDPDGTSWEWEVSGDHKPTDPLATDDKKPSSTSCTLYRDDDNDHVPVGTLRIVRQTGGKIVSLAVTPAPGIHETIKGYVRVCDGGDGPDGTNPLGYSSWVEVSVDVKQVNHAPTNIQPTTLPTMLENAPPLTATVTWNDVDFDPQNPDGWTLEVSPDARAWSAATIVTPEGVLVTIVGENVTTTNPDDTTTNASDDLHANITVAAPENFWGPFSFWAHVVDGGPHPTGTPQIVSAPSLITGYVQHVNQPPAAPYPAVMPTVESTVDPVVGTFYTSDPDADTRFFWEVAPTPAGPWGATANVAGGQVRLLGVSPFPNNAAVQYSGDLGFTGRYSFALRVSDGRMYSPVTTVTGWVSNGELTAELVRLTRFPNSPTRFDHLGTLSMTATTLEESLTGPGGATISVPLSELLAMAQSDPLAAGSVQKLLDPGTVELRIVAGGQTVFAGPVTQFSFNSADLTMTIDADGLAAWLGRRQIEDDTDRVYTATDLGVILGHLIDTDQRLPYGDLGFDTSSVGPVGQANDITFTTGTLLSDAASQIGELYSGPEWWIDHDTRKVWARGGIDPATNEPIQGRGTDKRREIVFDSGNALFDNTTGWDGLTTVAVVDGAEIPATNTTPAAKTVGRSAMNPDLMSRYGRHVTRFAAGNLGSAPACAQLADDYVGDHAFSPATLKFTHAVPATEWVIGPWDYGVGDAITCEIDTWMGLVIVDARVVNRSLHLDKGVYLIDVECETIGADGVIRPARSDGSPDIYSQMWTVRKAIGRGSGTPVRSM